jgi:hypothetical protein
MTTPRETLPEPFRSQIEAAALEFAATIVRAFEQSVIAASEDLAPPAERKPATALEKRIEALLGQARAGMDAEQVHDQVGGPLTTVLSTLQQMVVRGRVARRGNASGSRYYLR